MRVVLRFLTDDSGASAIEYGALVAAIAIACVGVWVAMGGELAKPFETVSGALQGAQE